MLGLISFNNSTPRNVLLVEMTSEISYTCWVIAFCQNNFVASVVVEWFCHLSNSQTPTPLYPTYKFRLPGRTLQAPLWIPIGLLMRFVCHVNGRIQANLTTSLMQSLSLLLFCVLSVVNISVPDEDWDRSTPGSHIGNGGVVIDCGSTRHTTSTLRPTCSARRSKSDTNM